VKATKTLWLEVNELYNVSLKCKVPSIVSYIIHAIDITVKNALLISNSAKCLVNVYEFNNLNYDYATLSRAFFWYNLILHLYNNFENLTKRTNQYRFANLRYICIG